LFRHFDGERVAARVYTTFSLLPGGVMLPISGLVRIAAKSAMMAKTVNSSINVNLVFGTVCLQMFSFQKIVVVIEQIQPAA